MPATVIPVKGLYLGFVGNISNEGYSLRTARQVGPTDPNSIAFGETIVLNATNTYSSVKTFIQAGGSVTAALPMGIAVSNVNINPTYSIGGSSDVLTPGGVYTPGAIMDGLVQGTVNVSCNNGIPTAGGNVYLRAALNSAVPAGVIGGLEAVADPNPVATTGTAAINSTALTVASGTGIAIGQGVSGVGIAAGSTVTAVAGTAVTLSLPTTAALSATAVSFSNTIPLTNFKWKTGFIEVDNTAQVTILARTIA
jgi:hypothetical protein